MSEHGAGGFESAAGTGQGRFRSFDGLRAIAAFAVVVTHAGAITGFTTRSPGGNYIARLEIGVPIFFVISGFLLYRPLAVAHLTKGDHVAPVTFWRRRAARIFPAYWVALTFVPVITGKRLVQGPVDVVMYYGLLQIYDADRVLGGLFQAWSLCAEVGFYLFLPVYAALLGRGRRTPRRQLRVELAGLAVLYAISVAFRLALVAADVRGPQFTWTLAWIDVFALGMLLAVVSAWSTVGGRSARLAAWVERRPGRCWAVAGVSFVVLANIGIPRYLAPFSPFHRMAGQFLAGIIAVALVAPAAFAGRNVASRVRRLLSHPVAIGLGLISYSVYLWHPAMLDKALDVTGGSPLSGSLPQVLVVALVLTVLVAAASYHLVERPASTVADAAPASASGPAPSPD